MTQASRKGTARKTAETASAHWPSVSLGQRSVEMVEATSPPAKAIREAQRAPLAATV